MKKIILLGDSIRMGYDKYVKDALDGVAEVMYPKENCKFALNVLRCIVEWRRDGGWGEDVDLVHWNAGLWDCVEILGDEPLTPIPFYEQTVLRVHNRLRTYFPKAKIVFATSTAVEESRYEPDFCRHNTVIEAYNAAAVRALANTDAIINDLYTFTKPLPASLRYDATHFNTDEGREVVGKKVLSFLCETLGVSSQTVDMENFKPEEYSAKSIAN